MHTGHLLYLLVPSHVIVTGIIMTKLHMGYFLSSYIADVFCSAFANYIALNCQRCLHKHKLVQANKKKKKSVAKAKTFFFLHLPSQTHSGKWVEISLKWDKISLSHLRKQVTLLEEFLSSPAPMSTCGLVEAWCGGQWTYTKFIKKLCVVEVQQYTQTGPAGRQPTPSHLENETQMWRLSGGPMVLTASAKRSGMRLPVHTQKGRLPGRIG